MHLNAAPLLYFTPLTKCKSCVICTAESAGLTVDQLNMEEQTFNNSPSSV